MSFLSRIHNFPVTHEAALLSFCTTFVVLTFAFPGLSILAPHWLRTVYCTKSRKSLHLPFACLSKALAPFLLLPSLLHSWFYPGLSAPPEHQIPHVAPSFPPFPPAIISLLFESALWQISHKRAFLGSPFPGGLFTPQHPESPLILVLPWFLWLLWWPVKSKEERSRGKIVLWVQKLLTFHLRSLKRVLKTCLYGTFYSPKCGKPISFFTC